MYAFAQAVADVGPYAYAPIKAQVGFQGPQRIFAGVRLTKRGLGIISIRLDPLRVRVSVTFLLTLASCSFTILS